MNPLKKLICVSFLLFAVAFPVTAFNQIPTPTATPEPTATPIPEVKAPIPLPREDRVYVCRIISVYDGDTGTCLAEVDPYFGIYQKIKVRFAHIDTPEIRGIGKEEGKVVRDIVKGMLLNKDVTLSHLKTGKYGRVVARVWVDDLYLNEWLVINGHAKVPWYDRSAEAKRLRALQP